MQDGDIEIAYVDESRMVKLTIRQSKTDQLGRKTTLFLSVTGNLACPLSSVSNFRAVFTKAVSNSKQLDEYPLSAGKNCTLQYLI